MRKPFSYMAAGLVVMGQAGTAAALGLGEIELQSALNQPLSANIRLLQADGLASDEILITLATPAEFERAGIDRPALLSELRFVIATDARAASSCRHRMTRSTCAISLRLASASLRSSGATRVPNSSIAFSISP